MVKLARKQFKPILEALIALDGLPTKPNKFAPKVKYAIFKNIRLLTTRVEDLEKTKFSIVREIAPQTFKIENGTPESVAFTKKWESFENEEEEIENFFRLSYVGLDADSEKNNIPNTILAELDPIIDDDFKS